MSNKLLDIMSSMIDKRLGERMMNREPATVISVDNAYKRAVVEFLNGSRFALLNKTGEKLYPGDSVWVEYNKLPASGYIAMRNGEADPLGGGGGLILNNAVVVSSDQSGVYASSASSEQVINVNNLENTFYGSPNDPIVIQGNLFTTSKATPSVEIDGLTYYDYSAYAAVMTDKLIIDGDIYTIELNSIDAQNNRYQFVACKNGVQLDTSTHQYYRYNYLNVQIPAQPYKVVFIPRYSSLSSPSGSHQYGYAATYIDMIFLTLNNLFRNPSYYTYSNQLREEPAESTDLTRAPDFGSSAEYDYAINLTKKTSLPPSLSGV